MVVLLLFLFPLLLPQPGNSDTKVVSRVRRQIGGQSLEGCKTTGYETRFRELCQEVVDKECEIVMQPKFRSEIETKCDTRLRQKCNESTRAVPKEVCKPAKRTRCRQDIKIKEDIVYRDECHNLVQHVCEEHIKVPIEVPVPVPVPVEVPQPVFKPVVEPAQNHYVKVSSLPRRSKRQLTTDDGQLISSETLGMAFDPELLAAIQEQAGSLLGRGDARFTAPTPPPPQSLGLGRERPGRLGFGSPALLGAEPGLRGLLGAEPDLRGLLQLQGGDGDDVGELLSRLRDLVEKRGEGLTPLGGPLPGHEPVPPPGVPPHGAEHPPHPPTVHHAELPAPPGCRSVVTQHCEKIPDKVKIKVPEEKCEVVPDVECHLELEDVQEPICDIIPIEECMDVLKEVPFLVPKEECEDKIRLECTEVEENVPVQVCTSIDVNRDVIISSYGETYEVEGNQTLKSTSEIVGRIPAVSRRRDEDDEDQSASGRSGRNLRDDLDDNRGRGGTSRDRGKSSRGRGGRTNSRNRNGRRDEERLRDLIDKIIDQDY